MAQNIRVSKTMRNIIDFYKEQYSYDDLLLTDSDIILYMMIKWLRQNYDENTCEEVLN